MTVVWNVLTDQSQSSIPVSSVLYYIMLYYIIVYYIIIMKVLFELTVKFCVKIIKYFYSLIKFKFFCVSVCFWPTHVADIPLRGCIERLQVCCVIRNDCKREDVPQWCVSCLYHRWLELNQGQFQCIVTATLSWAGTKISIASILYLRTAGGRMTLNTDIFWPPAVNVYSMLV